MPKHKIVELTPEQAVAAFDREIPSVRIRMRAVWLIQQFGMKAARVAEGTLKGCSDPERKEHWREVLRRVRAVTEE